VSETAIDPRFRDRERQPGLDFLRALAIIVVVIYHAGIFGFALPNHWNRFGWVGVDLFFVLSGYLIGGQLIAPLARGETINLRRFYSRRALRIMPAYFVILAVYFSLPSLREFPEISPLWKFLFSVQNIDLRGGTAFSHAWSLAIEDQFYLALPLLLILIRRWKRAGVVVPCTVFLGGLALRGFLAWQNPGEGGVSFRGFQLWIYYPSWTRLDPLVFGVVLAAIEKFRPSWWKRLINCAPWLWLPGFALLIWFGWTYPNVIVWLMVFLSLPRIYSLFRKRTEEERRYFEVTRAQRWTMSILYFGLIAVLALGMHIAHKDLSNRDLRPQRPDRDLIYQ